MVNNDVCSHYATEAQLEQAEDALLRQHDALGKRNGCYTEKQLSDQRKSRHDVSLDECRCRGTARMRIDGTLWRLCQNILEHELCPRRSVVALGLRIQGMSYRDLGDYLQVSHQTAKEDVLAAVKILRASNVNAIITVLKETF